MHARQLRHEPGENRYNTSIIRSLCFVGLLIILLAGGWYFVRPAQAQVPKCPSGFVWDRLSAIGCVQEDCFGVGGYYDGTNHCICPAGYDMCTEPVDYSGFDPTQCGPFCPDKVLTACVLSPQRCPSEIEAAPAIEGGVGVEGGGTVGGDEGVSPPGDTAAAVNFALRQVEQVLSGAETLPPTPIRALTGAALVTGLLGAWVLVDYMRERSIASEIASGTVKGGVEFEQANITTPQQTPQPTNDQLVDEQVAASAIDMITSMSEMGPLLNVDDSKDKAPSTKKPSKEQIETDRLAEEFLKGPKAEISPDIPHAKESIPIGGRLMNPEQRVFDGDEAIIILKELGKLSQGTSRDDKIPMPEVGLDHYIGQHRDGYPRKITLPTGKTIIVTKVEGILIGGNKDVTPGEYPTEIDFKKPVVITAELVEQVPEKPAPGAQPTQISTPATQPPAVQVSDATVEKLPPEEVEESPVYVDYPPYDPTATPPSPADYDQESLDTSETADPAGQASVPGPGKVPYKSPFLDEVVYLTEDEKLAWESRDRHAKALLDEADRILRGDYDKKDVPPLRGPTKPGHADIIDGEDPTTATDDF